MPNSDTSRSASPEPEPTPPKKNTFDMNKIKSFGKGKMSGVKSTLLSKHEKIQDENLGSYEERDPQQIHSDLKVNFRDVIAEPDGAHSFNTIWGTSFKTYSISKYWTYRVLTSILGIPFALFWGMYFAVLAFLNVWFIVPFVKAFVIQMKFLSKVWGLMVGTFLDPFFTSIGRMFSAIQINLRSIRT